MMQYSSIVNRDEGAAGAEFAMVLPLLVLMIFGLIDVGRYVWTLNELEKATQVGARVAVVTDMVPQGLATANFGVSLGQGSSIPTTSFGAAECRKISGTITCTCSSTPCPTLTPVDQGPSGAFSSVTTRMRNISRVVQDNNVAIRYENSGVGYAGDPNGPDVAPIVTVSVENIQFTPVLGQLFSMSLRFPTVSASLTLEDGQGTHSN